MQYRYDWLISLIKKYNFKTGVEVGIGSGKTTKRLLETGIQLTAVDIERKDHLFKVLPSNLRLLHMASLEAAVGKYDFVFIDADHSYEAVRADITAWRPLTRFLCGHDYGTEKWPGVTRAVDELCPMKFLGPDHCWGEWRSQDHLCTKRPM